MKTADADDAAGETEERLRIQLHLGGRDAVDLEPLADAASQVAERFRLLVKLHSDAVFGQRRPQAADVAEQVRVLPVAAENAPWARAGLGGGRRLGAKARIDRSLERRGRERGQDEQVRRRNPGGLSGRRGGVQGGRGRPKGGGVRLRGATEAGRGPRNR